MDMRRRAEFSGERYSCDGQEGTPSVNRFISMFFGCLHVPRARNTLRLPFLLTFHHRALLHTALLATPLRKAVYHAVSFLPSGSSGLHPRHRNAVVSRSAWAVPDAGRMRHYCVLRHDTIQCQASLGEGTYCPVCLTQLNAHPEISPAALMIFRLGVGQLPSSTPECLCREGALGGATSRSGSPANEMSLSIERQRPWGVRCAHVRE